MLYLRRLCSPDQAFRLLRNILCGARDSISSPGQHWCPDITCPGLIFICSFELFIWGCRLHQSLLPPLKLLAHWPVFEGDSWWLRPFCAQTSSGRGALIMVQRYSLSVNPGPANLKLRRLHLWGDRMRLWLSAGFSLRWQAVAWAGSGAVWLWSPSR